MRISDWSSDVCSSDLDGFITGHVVIALVAGLPAYVLVKLLTPGFYARKDTKTPVKTALVVLLFNILVILVVIGPFGIVGLASATAAASWLQIGSASCRERVCQYG